MDFSHLHLTVHCLKHQKTSLINFTSCSNLLGEQIIRASRTNFLTKLILHLLGEKEFHQIYKPENEGLQYTDVINLKLRSRKDSD